MAKIREQTMAVRVLPDDIAFELESLIERMVRLLLIEISAFHTFAWAEDVLSDRDLVAGDGRPPPGVLHPGRRDAARRLPEGGPDRDARPHFVGTSGKRYPGTEMIGRIWDRA